MKTLSEKIKEDNIQIGISQFGDIQHRLTSNLREVDVKQFIKDLKELLVNGNYYGEWSFTHLFTEIDKLAGDKLI